MSFGVGYSKGRPRFNLNGPILAGLTGPSPVKAHLENAEKNNIGPFCLNGGSETCRLLKSEGQLYSTVWIQLLEDWVLEQMYTVRPVVETGYENLLLVRLLLEMRMPSIRESSVAEGLTVEGILEKWSELKPVIMAEWGEERDALIHLFGKVRDEWMDEDLDNLDWCK